MVTCQAASSRELQLPRAACDPAPSEVFTHLADARVTSTLEPKCLRSAFRFLEAARSHVHDCLLQHDCAAGCAWLCSWLSARAGWADGSASAVQRSNFRCAARAANTEGRVSAVRILLKNVLCSRTRRKLVQRTFIRLWSFTPRCFFKFTLRDARDIFE